MKSWRRDLGRLLSVFHSPKRTFAAIGDTPGVCVVLAALFGSFTAVTAISILTTEAPIGREEEAVSWLAVPLVLAGSFVVSGVYYLVFHLFGAEPRYRVILSVALHAMWVVSVLDTALVLLEQLISGGPPFEIREFLISSFGVGEDLALQLAFLLDPLNIGRLLLTGLGFAIALRLPRTLSLGIVFAGWLGFHSLPLLRFLLF